ncbi:hypothetical protein MPH_10646 [Macrophomina phaseolina MS6]|uniref:Anaphase-promoting complex subunit 4 n=1 Tax=Macrophomina phaseolina (strain MS6) TaxID=1126212 RepID=K2RPW1_MACPH|nr:hypothetical protein MPH_10646 [Macrophomina phaseolina MS6]
MDLVAVVTQEETLDVYRFNGQRAFGLKRKSFESKVDSICWKFNGQHIAIAWDDGAVDIVSSETGKTVKQVRREAASFATDDESTPRISSLAWGVNFIDVNAVKDRTGTGSARYRFGSSHDEELFEATEEWDQKRQEITLDDFLERQPDLSKLGISPDLPDQIALTDVQDALPKLSVIPAPPANPFQMISKAKSTDAFSTQQSIDAIFHSQHLRDSNAVDVLLTGCDNGTVSPTIYDSLEIGGMRVPSEWSLSSPVPLLHASHPYSCSHLTLMETRDSTQEKPRIIVVPLTLRFIPSNGIYLHLIASKTAQLQNLLQYLQSSFRTIIAYFHNARDLPSRFMRNIGETLAEKEEGDFISNLYHLAVSGDCPPTIKEWLVDELTENGHKRWDQAASQGYTRILEMTHENVIPALDRTSIVVSMLRGLARYTGSSAIINVPPEELSNILDTLRCLRLLAHDVLIYAGEERRQFTAFSKWLRHEIDTQASDPSSQTAEEAAERDPGIDHNLLLAYIPGALTKSKLAPFLRRQQEIINPRPELLAYDLVKHSMNVYRENQPIQEGSLCVWTLQEILQGQCRELFAQITAWQATNSSMGCGLVLEECRLSEARDMRMVFEKLNNGSDISTYTAFVPQDAKSEIRLHRIVHSGVFDTVDNAIRTMQTITIKFAGCNIQDLKFVDDTSFMVLFRREDASYLLSFPYSAFSAERTPSTLHHSHNVSASHSASSSALPCGTPAPDEAREVWNLEMPETWAPFVRHVFPASERFTPLKIDVNGRKDRRVVCVLSDDLKHYKIYDLDYESGKEGEADTTVDTVMSG